MALNVEREITLKCKICISSVY